MVIQNLMVCEISELHHLLIILLVLLCMLLGEFFEKFVINTLKYEFFDNLIRKRNPVFQLATAKVARSSNGTLNLFYAVV